MLVEVTTTGRGKKLEVILVEVTTTGRGEKNT